MRSYTALMNFSVENRDCKHNCTALGRLWQLCWWGILTSSTHWDLSGQPMTADNRTSSPAEWGGNLLNCLSEFNMMQTKR